MDRRQRYLPTCRLQGNGEGGEVDASQQQPYGRHDDVSHEFRFKYIHGRISARSLAKPRVLVLGCRPWSATMLEKARKLSRCSSLLKKSVAFVYCGSEDYETISHSSRTDGMEPTGQNAGTWRFAFDRKRQTSSRFDWESALCLSHQPLFLQRRWPCPGNS